jgi:hypothetical protein
MAVTRSISFKKATEAAANDRITGGKEVSLTVRLSSLAELLEMEQGMSEKHGKGFFIIVSTDRQASNQTRGVEKAALSKE